jgi:HK97 family phage prohead protease
MAEKKPDLAITMEGTRERRAMLGTVECRDASDTAATISGYAAVFNAETLIGGGMWGFREQIAPGAFDQAIQDDDVRALFNHDPNYLLGRNVAGTLRLKSDKKGLRYEVDLPDTAAGRDVKTLVDRGDVSGSSFGFVVEEDEWVDGKVEKDGRMTLPLRTIRKVSLYDVSPVTYPAYPQTTVSARSRAEAMAASDQAAVTAAKELPADVRAAQAAVAAARARFA